MNHFERVIVASMFAALMGALVGMTLGANEMSKRIETLEASGRCQP